MTHIVKKDQALTNIVKSGLKDLNVTRMGLLYE